MTTTRKHLTFVYGTLKAGYGNNRRLLGEAEFVRKAKTKPLYRMFDNGGYPCLIKDEKNGSACEGEIWRVNDRELRNLDILEGVPHHYDRHVIEIEGDETVEGYIYQSDPTTSSYWKECTPVWNGGRKY